MNLDEQIFKSVDKQMLNQLKNENVIPYSQTKIQKGQFLLPFFYVCSQNLQRRLQRNLLFPRRKNYQIIHLPDKIQNRLGIIK